MIKNSLTAQLESIMENDESETYDYSCAMFDVSGKLRNQINQWIDENIDQNDIFWGEEEDLGITRDSHVTIVYGYTTNEPKEIQDSFKNYPKDSVKIKLGKLKYFPHKEYSVLYVEIKSGDIQKLHKVSTSSGLEIKESFDTYTPHLTLAYLKSTAISKYYNDKSFENIEYEGKVVRITTADGKKSQFRLSELKEG